MRSQLARTSALSHRTAWAADTGPRRHPWADPPITSSARPARTVRAGAGPGASPHGPPTAPVSRRTSLARRFPPSPPGGTSRHPPRAQCHSPKGHGRPTARGAQQAPQNPAHPPTTQKKDHKQNPPPNQRRQHARATTRAAGRSRPPGQRTPPSRKTSGPHPLGWETPPLLPLPEGGYIVVYNIFLYFQS